jgi:hypothetical protein
MLFLAEFAKMKQEQFVAFEPVIAAKAFPSEGGSAKRQRLLQTFDELNEHSVRVGGDDASDVLPEGLRFLAQKGDAMRPQGRRGRINIRDAKREAIESHMVQSRISLPRGRGFQPLHQVDEHFAGCLGRG